MEQVTSQSEIRIEYIESDPLGMSSRSPSYSKCSTNSFCFVCPVAEIPERLGWTADTDKVEGNDYELFDVVDEKFYKREYFEYVAGCIMPHALFPDIEE